MPSFIEADDGSVRLLYCKAVVLVENMSHLGITTVSEEPIEGLIHRIEATHITYLNPLTNEESEVFETKVFVYFPSISSSYKFDKDCIGWSNSNLAFCVIGEGEAE